MVDTTGSPLVLSGWARTVILAVERLGGDPDEVLRAAGVSRETFELEDELPITVTTKLWQEAARCTGDPAFGLKAARYVSPASLRGLAYAVLASATLREAIGRFERYSRVVSDAVSLRTAEVDDEIRVEFEIATTEHAPSYEAMDAVFSTIVRALRALTENRIPLRAVALRRPAPRDPTPFHQFFGVAVEFGTSTDMLVLPAEPLDNPLPHANSELARLNEQVVASYLSRLQQIRPTDRARMTILQELPSGEVSLSRVARSMGVSQRGLQRQLADANTTFAALLDDVREELAKDYLRTSEHSNVEIAFLLGFADGSAFSRAFKRWTGSSPAAFRAEIDDGAGG